LARQPQPKPSTGSTPPAPCTCGRPSWSEIADLALEIMELRERIDLAIEDEVEWKAAGRLRGYQMLGGCERLLGSWRAEVRENLRRGGDGFGEMPV